MHVVTLFHTERGTSNLDLDYHVLKLEKDAETWEPTKFVSLAYGVTSLNPPWLSLVAAIIKVGPSSVVR